MIKNIKPSLIAAALAISFLGSCSLLPVSQGDKDEQQFVAQAFEDKNLSEVMVFNKNKVGQGYKNFRIPALAVSKQGTLLAFAEGRIIRSDHTKGPLVLRRSSDGGKTWGELQEIARHGSDSLNNPSPVILDDGTILIIYDRFPENYHSRALSHEGVGFVNPGHSGIGVQTNHVISSTDDGKTWSAPIDITAQTKRLAPVNANFTGPGPATLLKIGKYAGRIVMPSCDFVGEGSDRKFSSYTTYSDDNGKTWKLGEHAQNAPQMNANETQMVELDDGRLLMTVRAKGNRYLAYSNNGGETWTQLTKQKDLPDSGAMGSVINYQLGNNKSVLLHSVSSKRINNRRSRGAVYASFDNGQSWPMHKVYHAGSYDYSSIAQLPNGDIGILGEFDWGVDGKFNDIRFMRINKAWLLSK